MVFEQNKNSFLFQKHPLFHEFNKCIILNQKLIHVYLQLRTYTPKPAITHQIRNIGQCFVRSDDSFALASSSIRDHRNTHTTKQFDIYQLLVELTKQKTTCTGANTHCAYRVSTLVLVIIIHEETSGVRRFIHTSIKKYWKYYKKKNNIICRQQRQEAGEKLRHLRSIVIVELGNIEK